jgi:hypothetical protein
VPVADARTAEYYHRLYGTALREAEGLALNPSQTASQELAQIREEMAERGRSDLHFFAYMACGFTAITPPEGIHGRLCAFLGDPTVRCKWIEVFRGGLKSTLCTVASSVQAIACDPDEHILMTSCTEKLSQSFVRQAMSIIKGDGMFRWLYPEIRPLKDSWSSIQGASIDREWSRKQRGRVREYSLFAGSLKTSLTGTHPSRMKYDDLVIDRNVRSKQMQLDLIEQFISWQYMLQEEGTPQDMCGTPYRDYDLYAWLRREHPEWFVRFEMPAWAGDDWETGELAWPEGMSRAAIAKQMSLDPQVGMAQLGLDVKPAAYQYFAKRMFRYWRLKEEVEGQECGAVVVDPKALTCYMGVDPGSGLPGGDPGAIVVIGVGEGALYYVLDAVSDEWDSMELIERIFILWDKWNVQRTRVEHWGAGAALSALLQSEMSRRGRYAFIDKPRTTGERKPVRIKTLLGPRYNCSAIFHHWSTRGDELEKQLLGFRDKGQNDTNLFHDDLLDAEVYAMGLAQEFGAFGAPREDQMEENWWSTFGQYEGLGWTREDMMKTPARQLREHYGGKVTAGGVGLY